MKSILLFTSLLFCSTLFAKTNQIVKRVTNIDSNNRAMAASEASSGKADTYIFLAPNDVHDFLLPANQTNCDTVYDEYMKAIDFDTLKKLGDGNHIYYAIAQYQAFGDGQMHNTDNCDANQRGQLIVRIMSLLQSRDEIGRAGLAKYVADIAAKKFYGYSILWEKPLQIVTHYEIGNWHPINVVSADMPILGYFKSTSAIDINDPDLILFDKAVHDPENKKALTDFFKQRVEDPSIVEKVFETYSQNKETTTLSISTDFSYLLRGDVTVGDLLLGQIYMYNCSGPGQCYR